MSLEFSVSPSTKGDVYATTFEFKKSNLPLYDIVAWDFGDGHASYGNSETSHIYNFPGIFKVSLSAWSKKGDFETSFVNIDVDYVLRDAIRIEQIPSRWSLPGLPSNEPFIVSLTSCKINEPLSIVLQALNTKSVPHYAVPTKWGFLVPRWRFIDSVTNEIINEAIQIKTTPVYKNSKVIGVVGSASFYYIDDLATGTNQELNCPLLITATLSTQNFEYPPETLIYPYHSYSNSEVARAVISWQVGDVVPTKLRVTENFLNDIYPIKWSGVPIPIMITCDFAPANLESFSSSATISSTTVLSYPRTNELGALSLVDVKILGLREDEYIVDEAPLYFKAFDQQNNTASGYIFTTITPLVTASTVTVQVSTVIHNQLDVENEFPFPDGFPISPEVYVSHPYKRVINKINVVTYPKDCSSVSYFKELGILTDGSISSVGVPALSSTSIDDFQLSGTSGIFALTYNPVKELIYAADSDQDKVYAINSKKEIIQTLVLSSIFTQEKSSPSYISVDSKHNIWVSLYDNHTIVKYDYTLQTMLASAVPMAFSDVLVDFNEGSPLIAPPIVETDKEDNIWVCYSHPVSSMLLKFDQEGNYLATAADMLNDSIPVSLAINKKNQVWVACRESNEVKCYETNGDLLSSFEFNTPSYIALDKQNRLWILHGYNLISVLNTNTQSASSWRLENIPEPKITPVFNKYTLLSDYFTEDITITNNTNELWGGLTIDVYNRVWIIDNENNNVGVFSSNNPEMIRIFKVTPSATKNYILLKANDEFVTEVDSNVVRSAQALGDWSGNRWYQKYAGKYSILPVSGTSAFFSIKDLSESTKIAKINDDFNCAEYFQSLALPEILNQNDGFFDKFLPGVVGHGDVQREDLGRIVYEKIANYVSNHSDIETAEIDQLVSLANCLSVPSKSFGIDFPEEIKRLINIFSVHKHFLRGTPKFETDLDNNVGAMLTETSYVSTGQYLFVKDKQFDENKLVCVSTLSGGSDEVYPLYKMLAAGMRQPLLANYYFFEYNIDNQIGYQSNLIDWSSVNTTMSYNLSTNEEWYGDEQLIETYFNNLLTRRLFER